LKKDEMNDDAVVAPSQPPDEENFPGKAPEGNFPGKPAEDLGPLVARAQDRFGGCMLKRVADAVELYGRDWVEVVLWGVLTLRDWGGVLTTLGHWRTEGGPSDRTVERARRELAKASPKPAVARRPEAERPPAEVLLADIRREGFRLEIGAGGRLELIDPELVPLDGPRPFVERMRRQMAAVMERDRAEFRSRLAGLEAEVLSLMRVDRSDERLPGEGPRGSLAGVAVAARPRPSLACRAGSAPSPGSRDRSGHSPGSSTVRRVPPAEGQVLPRVVGGPGSWAFPGKSARPKAEGQRELGPSPGSRGLPESVPSPGSEQAHRPRLPREVPPALPAGSFPGK
jgi:hypothetical protein